MNKIKSFKPLLDRCLIKKTLSETKSAGGIILPKANERDMRVGEVVATGPGYYGDGGHFIKNRLNVGDFVLLPEYSGTKINLEDKTAEYFVYRDSEILAKLEKKI
jgi:chaperonin GroES